MPSSFFPLCSLWFLKVSNKCLMKKNSHKIINRVNIAPEFPHLYLSLNPYSPERTTVNIAVSVLPDCFWCRIDHVCACRCTCTCTCVGFIQFCDLLFPANHIPWHFCTSFQRARSSSLIAPQQCPCAYIHRTFSSPLLLTDSMLSLVFLYYKICGKKNI